MTLQKIILNIVLKFFSLFLPLFSIKKNRITFISLTADTLKDDFYLINKELEKYNDLDIKYNLLKFKKNIIGDFLYFLNCIKQLFIINTSRVVILNDNNYVVSNFKRKEVIVVQIWHACGAVKKFGNDIDREYVINNYDYVLSTSDFWKTIYARSFNVRKENVLPLGMARTDVLFDECWVEKSRKKMLKRYPILKDKYIYLYAPTFRGNIIQGFSYEQLDLNDLVMKLPSNVVILYRMHPLLEGVSLGDNENVINMANENLNDLLACADCLISDYSSILFDFSILKKRMICYVPDLENYKKTLGLNLNFDSIPGEKCFTPQELIQSMNHFDYDEKEVETFKNLYFKEQDGKSAKRIGYWLHSLI